MRESSPKKTKEIEESKSKFLNVIASNESYRLSKVNILRQIQRLFEDSFEIRNISGTKRIHSKTLLSLVHRVVSSMKPLDVDLRCTGRDSGIQKVTTLGVGTVLKNGGYISALRDKNGVFFRQALYGDGFLMMGYDDTDADYPIKFRNIDTENLYYNKESLGIHNLGSESNAEVMIAVFKYTKARFRKMYPKAKKDIQGRIPRDLNFQRNLPEDKSTYISDADSDIVEVAHCFDIEDEKPKHMVFAGSGFDFLEEENGEEYPYVEDGVPQIPIFQFMFFPSSEGFLNYGIGHAVYDLVLAARELDNMALWHADENVGGMTLLYTPRNTASSFGRRLEEARELRKNGYRAFVPVEYDAGSQNQVSAQTLQSSPLTQEYERMFTRLEGMIKKLGLDLDGTDRGTNVTATQILAEEETASATLKQVQEYNATGYEKVVKLTITAIKSQISVSNNTPIESPTMIEMSDGSQIEAAEFTLGGLSRELRENRYYVISNSRSGVYPSMAYERATIQSILPYLAPGSQAFNREVSRLGQIMGRDISINSLGAAQQPTQGAMANAPQVSPETEAEQITKMA